MKTGIQQIAAERDRQITTEGWTPEHDAEHPDGALAEAAISYTTTASAQVRGNCGAKLMDDQWPWNPEWWKPSDNPIRNLVKAGALIAAEIDRLQRLANPQPALSREHWIKRCAARLEDRAAVHPTTAIDIAESQLENLNNDLTENPEDAADEEISNWPND